MKVRSEINANERFAIEAKFDAKKGGYLIMVTKEIIEPNGYRVIVQEDCNFVALVKSGKRRSQKQMFFINDFIIKHIDELKQMWLNRQYESMIQMVKDGVG